MRGAPVRPREPPATSTWPLENFVDAAPAVREQTQHGALDQADVGGGGRAAGDADVERAHLAGVGLAGVDPEAGLGGVEGDGDRGAHRAGADHARGGIHAGGHIHADDGRAAGVRGVDRLGDRSAGLAGEAGAEQRVDDRSAPAPAIAPATPARKPCTRRSAGQAQEVLARVSLQLLRGPGGEDIDLAAGVAQQARGHQPVAAVVALAAEHRHGAVGRELLDGAGHADPGALHQVQRGHPLLVDRPAVDRPHRLGVGQRQAPLGEGSHELRS